MQLYAARGTAPCGRWCEKVAGAGVGCGRDDDVVQCFPLSESDGSGLDEPIGHGSFSENSPLMMFRKCLGAMATAAL